MSKNPNLFTSECVTMGHPDKMADQISDAVLDAVLEQDPRGRVACEVLVNTGFALVAGEITTTGHIAFPDIVRRTVCDIGYTDPKLGFDGNTCAVLTAVDRQSPDIALGVDAETSAGHQVGAGDQGMMFGFACDETEECMPLPLSLSRAIVHRLAEVRQKGILPFLGPDGKSQVTVEYDGRQPVRIAAVVVSSQHSDAVEMSELRDAVRAEVVKVAVPPELIDDKTVYHINPTGRFVLGGPHADCGLTGRKIIVDTYGGMGRHGGGAFSGKDPTKVDRTASYAARHAAKNIVAAGLATHCELQLAYAIGIAEPVSVRVETFGTGKVSDDVIAGWVRELFDFAPTGMIDRFDLLRPIYVPTARYGHFGIREGRSWEATDSVDALRRKAGF